MNQIATVERNDMTSHKSLVGSFSKHFLNIDRRRRKIQPMLSRAWPTSWDSGKPLLKIENAERDVEAARNWCDKMPPGDHIVQLIDDMRKALDTHAEQLHIEVGIAMMIDSFPNGRPGNPAGYADALVLWADESDLPLSEPVLAAAIFSWVGKSKFIPTVSEFLEECRHARQLFETAVRQAGHLLDMRHSAEELLEHIGDYSHSSTTQEMDNSK